jgi:2-methylisocitrate lyase-like PEP mutase family enzyme
MNTKNQFETFKALHQQSEPLLIGNVWNAQSAKVFEKLNFKAIATSSAAVAETLGYADGEQMSFEEYMFVVKHIIKAVPVPLSVDLESGYGLDVSDVAENILKLSKAGVVGINIEDSILRNGKRTIEEMTTFTAKLEEICQHLKSFGVNMFINVRCDAFLLNLPKAVDEAVKRLKVYQQTGVHGLFFPCITALSDMQAITKVSTLPVNVMCMPGLCDFTQLRDAGVKRISMGNFVNQSIYNHLENRLQTIVQEKKFESLFQ